MVTCSHLGRLLAESWAPCGMVRRACRGCGGWRAGWPGARSARRSSSRELIGGAHEEGPRVEGAVVHAHHPRVLLVVGVPPGRGPAGGSRGDVLDPRHLPQAGRAVGAAHPARAIAAPGRRGLAEARHAVVDGDHPGRELALQARRDLRVARPAAGGEAVRAVVGEADGLVERVHRHDGKHGAEGLVPHDRHPVVRRRSARWADRRTRGPRGPSPR